MKKIVFFFLLTLNFYIINAQNSDAKAYAFVDKLMSKMSLEDKVGQMTQISIEAFLKTDANGNVTNPHELDTAKLGAALREYKIGSILNVGGDAQTRQNWQQLITQIQKQALSEGSKIPILYGIDAIHGNNYTSGSILFPQEIAMAASFNPSLAKEEAEVTAYETRASFTPWVFSPVLGIGRQPLWPRFWETFGEDPLLVSTMGTAMIQGFHGNDVSDKYHVLACLKHYMGYSMPLSGHDRTPAWIPERELREYFLPPFAEAVKQGALTVMVCSGEINGVPVHANKHILTDILKGELKFKGFACSDWQDIEYLYQRHHVAVDNKDAVRMAINAGIDMSMVPTDFSFTKDLFALVKEGKVSMSRINDAVRRILYVKYKSGIFQYPTGNADDYPLFGGKEHQQVNYDIAAQCITLLKNKNNILPVKKNEKILVTGASANTMRSLDGGWSRVWQGTTSDETEKDKNTILEAMQQTFGNENVSYEQGVSFDSTINIDDAVAKAKDADVIVLCAGESSYAETPGNINDLTISTPQIKLAKALAKTGKPIILVLTEGRPRVISAIEPYTSAVIDAYYLGNQGGNVIADVLDGKINPSGKLPFTYPRYTNSFTTYYRKYTEDKDVNDEIAGYNPQWEFGTGLSYTTFKYSNLRLSSDKLSDDAPIKVSVDVTNTGAREGKETVLMYVSDLVASITPEVKRLRGFEKIDLEPSETKTVSFTITKDKLSFINNDLKRVTEPGKFVVHVADLSKDFEY
ncbi:beta-glucosidase [Arachidicoccus ginsenosidimutans]|uniref:glycoside hydrolase family 3 N-terminal domain-containing protein n=1 Tax=Arachidicoccus sp. BS20 TaxID=1850526 RepID=UPI0007F0EE67|nr:glycoside hydrolase family 3 N-terminal domain-containing protein [Arachidicoccus sp. BS20]ANI90266.1 beta-glucosidase [Arachidicoccus sp. BS20]